MRHVTLAGGLRTACLALLTLLAAGTAQAGLPAPGAASALDGRPSVHLPVRPEGSDPSLGRVVGWSAFAASAALLLAYVLRRRRAALPASGDASVRLLQSLALGERRFVHVLSLRGRTLIVGASPAGLSTLADLAEVPAAAIADGPAAERPLDPDRTGPLSPVKVFRSPSSGRAPESEAEADAPEGRAPRPSRPDGGRTPSAPAPAREEKTPGDRLADSQRSFLRALHLARTGGMAAAVLVAALSVLSLAPSARAEEAPPAAAAPADDAAGGAGPATAGGPALRARLGPLEVAMGGAAGAGALTDDQSGDYSGAMKVALLIALLSFAPAILLTMTAFTRCVIVLGFVRTALGTPNLPPNQVLVGLSLFLTSFLMAPVAKRVYEDAYAPHQRGEITFQAAISNAKVPVLAFMVGSTRETDLALFLDVADAAPERVEDVPIRAALPAFVISELKTAFQMGFVLFLPFLVIDLAVASILLAMGMVMLSPITVSTPLKLLLFVLVDGWNLLARALLAGTSL